MLQSLRLLNRPRPMSHRKNGQSRLTLFNSTPLRSRSKLTWTASLFNRRKRRREEVRNVVLANYIIALYTCASHSTVQCSVQVQCRTCCVSMEWSVAAAVLCMMMIWQSRKLAIIIFIYLSHTISFVEMHHYIQQLIRLVRSDSRWQC